MSKLFCAVLLLPLWIFAAVSPEDATFLSLQKTSFDKTENFEKRWASLMEISKIENGKAEEVLLKAANEPEWFMKNAAMIGLDSLQSKKINEVSKKLISDPALVVRSVAAQMLMKTKPNDLRTLLWTELNKSYNFKKKKSLWIRYQILEFLAQNPLPSEKSKFLSLVSEQDEKVRSLSKGGIVKLQN